MMSHRSRKILSTAGILLVLVVFSLLLARKFWIAAPPEQVPAPAPAVERNLREVILYFGAPDGTRLIPEVREIEDCLEPPACLLGTVEALTAGPVGDLTPVFPPTTVVRGVAEEEGVATVDFGRGLLKAHPGGSLSELLTVLALADTLAANFPHIRQVRILVEGEPVETLKGHVDLREPVTADFSWSREPGSEPADDHPSRP